MKLGAALLLLLVLPVALAGAAPGPSLSDFTTWTTAGSRIAFEASAVGGKRGYLWVQSFASTRPRLLRSGAPVGQGQVDQIAPGPKGTWGCLERTVGNSESHYAVDLLSSRGGGTQVATAGGPTGTTGGPPVSSIPQVIGDGSFLGYLYVTSGGVVQLYQITPSGHGKRIANLVGASAPQDVALANGNLAIRELDGTVEVFTLAGKPLATIKANAASVALAANRVVVRTRDRRLAVYGLRGGLVHNWRLAASSWTVGLAAYGRFAVYLGANKAVHAVRLSNGRDVIVARAGAGFFFGGVSLQAPGAVVPLTAQQETTLRFLPTAALAKALGT